MVKTQCLAKMQSLCLRTVMILLVSILPLSLWAQGKIVSGVVTDSNNEAIIGLSVLVKNSTHGTITDIDGKYSITVSEDAILEFKYLGLVSVEEKVAGRTTINVMMKESESTALNEVVVVGYGTQKKVTLTGAVSGIKGDEMIKTKNENPQNMLTGKIAGVRVWQKSAEPGSFNNNFDIRAMGSPLVVIDGIPREVSDFQRLNSNDIEDISVLKDASAAIYGVRAANGVVLVTTKKGSKEDKAKVTYNGSYTIQKPSGMPVLANAEQTMTLFNEKSMNSITGGSLTFTEADFAAYRNGTRRTTDWTSLIFSDYAPQTQHDVSISGGNENTQYYIGLGNMFQEGFFKSGDLSYEKTNLRANITTKIAKGLSFDISLSGMLDKQNNPYSTSTDIIRNYWRQGVLYPAYADAENTMLNYEGLDLEENTVAKMTSDISGYRRYEQKNFQSSASVTYDFGTITPLLKGFSAKAMYSFDYKMNNNTIYRKEYYQYAYDELTQTYNQKLYNLSSPSSLKREFYSKQQTLAQVLLNYDRAFGEHNISAVLGAETQKWKGDNFYAQRNLAFSTDYLFAGVEKGQTSGMSMNINDLYELAYSAVIGRVNYAYGNRYIAEVQFRYDGSSRFAKGQQWGFFPSASLGWRISEEPLFKSISFLSFVDQLKLRVSYGKMGDDGDTEYDWVSGYEYPATSGNSENGYFNQYAPGYLFNGNFVYGVSTKALPNEYITWYTARTFDFGIDFEAWNGLFGFSYDFFNRYREGLFVRSGELSTVVGASAPNENLNSDRFFGIDLELSHRNRIGDFTYRVKAIGTIARQMYLNAAQNTSYGNSYDEWRNDNLNNRYQGVQFGYESAGRYSNWQDVRTYQIFKERDVLPGDYKYIDWNGDGEINSQDEHPFAYDQTPWLNYSLSFDCSYKNFDFNILFQGSALGSMEYKEPLYSIWGTTNGGGALTQYLDRWHPTDTSADPYDPNTEWITGYYAYTGRYPKGNSEFNRVSTAYLRLKSIELGYTLPKIKAMSSMNLRVFANAYNLFTITAVKFVDPEHPDDDLGRLYPLSKTVTMGLSLSF